MCIYGYIRENNRMIDLLSLKPARVGDQTG